MSGLIYAELAKVDDTRIKHVSEYKFFERYGEVGEYMRLELKMLLRNRRCKGALRNVLLVVIAFSCLLSFSSLYDTSKMCIRDRDVSVIYRPEFLQIISGLWMLIQGRILNHKMVKSYRTRKVKVLRAQKMCIRDRYSWESFYISHRYLHRPCKIRLSPTSV